MTPANATLVQPRSVTAGLAGPAHASARLQIPGRAAWTLHGEVLGCISACLADEDFRRRCRDLEIPLPPRSTILVDLYNLQRNLDEASRSSNPAYWLYKHARCFYRWLVDILARAAVRPDVDWTRGHQDDQDTPEARLNAAADAHATAAHATGAALPYWPTHAMNEFTFWNAEHGYIESSLADYAEQTLAQHYRAKLPAATSEHMLPRPEWQTHRPAEGPYLYSTYGYAAQVQMLARSHALPTAVHIANCFKPTKAEPNAQPPPRKCLFCDDDEDAPHAFCHCQHYTTHRASATAEAGHILQKAVDRMAEKQTVRSVAQRSARASLLALADKLYTDDACWGGDHRSYYWIGQLPLLEHHVQPLCVSREDAQRETAALCKALHSTNVRLAGRIWGIRARKSAELYRESQAKA